MDDETEFYIEKQVDRAMELGHVDYPHHFGRLYDCPACENGPCYCDPTTDAPCVSIDCIQTRRIDNGV